jgi:hypothetical protein
VVLVPKPKELPPNPVLLNPLPSENAGVPKELVVPPPRFPNEVFVPLPKFKVGAEVVEVKVKLVPPVDPIQSQENYQKIIRLNCERRRTAENSKTFEHNLRK